MGVVGDHGPPPRVETLRARDVRPGDHLEEGRRVVLLTLDYEHREVRLVTAICSPVDASVPTFLEEEHPHWTCHEVGVVHRDHRETVHLPDEELVVVRGVPAPSA